jgi:uncharacterized repeat protein (TIGR03803 family)
VSSQIPLRKSVLPVCVLVAFGSRSPVANAAYQLQTLLNFNGANGDTPYGALIMDPSGNIYGSASDDYNGTGNIFEITAGSHTVIPLGTENGSPRGRLSLAPNGNLYGTALFDDVFSVNIAGRTATSIASFNLQNGYEPFAGLVAGSAGNLFGTTSLGGDIAQNNGFGLGTVFEINASTHALNDIYQFDGTQGTVPRGDLIFDSAGNLYGTTEDGGTSNDGTIFKLNPTTHALTTLASFTGINGANPVAGLIMDSAGNLFGTTSEGGPSGAGTVFELKPGDTSPTTLINFNVNNGAEPQCDLAFDAAGDIFGTTSYGGSNSDGTIFEITASTDAFATIANFDGAHGAFPWDGVLVDAAGNIYGTTTNGGTGDEGVVFELAVVPEPASLAIAGLAAFFLVRPRWSRRTKQSEQKTGQL